MENRPPLNIGRELAVIAAGVVILLLLTKGSLVFSQFKPSLKLPFPRLLPLSATKNTSRPALVTKALPHFTSCEDLQAAQQKVARQKTSPNQQPEFMAPDAAGNQADTSAPEPYAINPEYSRTNVQVAGVDEPDIVKTDGQYIYAFAKAKRSVAIIKAAPAESITVVGRVDYPSGTTTHEFFLDASRLVILGYRDNNTFVDIWDVTDPVRPVLKRSLGFEGGYLAARLANGAVYVALNGQPSNQPVPLLRDSAAASTPKPAVACDQVEYIQPIVSDQSLILASLALTAPDSPVHTKIIMGAGEKVFMSPLNFYIAQQAEQSTSPQPTRVPGVLYDRQPDSSSPPASGPQTNIYKFTLDNTAINFVGQVSAPGRVLNQFSMDEYDGYFRLATTSGRTASQWSNNLYVFDQDLAQVGKLTGLAPGEQIYSARFMGKRAYLVTFRQTDPLFAIDLGDPTNPQALGELKLPGFSQYLHPYDDTHLIGIGKHATDQGQVLGVKVALFDVADVGAPKQIDTLEIGGPGADSEILRNHKALLFDQVKHLLVLPIHLPGNAFSGVYVLDVSPQGFAYRNRLSHPNARRSLYIDNALYTLSDSSLNSYNLTSLTPLSSTGL